MMATRLFIHGLELPWAVPRITVYLGRETADNNDCWAYFTRNDICKLTGLSKGCVFSSSGLVAEVPEITPILPGRTRFVVELGVFRRAMQERFSLDEDEWDSMTTITSAMENLEQAIEKAIEKAERTDALHWDLCVTPTPGVIDNPPREENDDSGEIRTPPRKTGVAHKRSRENKKDAPWYAGMVRDMEHKALAEYKKSAPYFAHISEYTMTQESLIDAEMVVYKKRKKEAIDAELKAYKEAIKHSLEKCLE